MDNWQAEHLFQNGAICIIEETPVRLEFGFDLNCWSLAENFRGMKMIPPGFHCMYYSSSMGIRQGFLWYSKSREVV
jgi:A1 cistron-splicing factor AAR2